MKPMKEVLYRSVMALCIISIFSCGDAKQPQTQKRPDEKAAAVKNDSAVADTLRSRAASDRRLVVYYFHGHARCPTCIQLENYAKSEVEAAFASAIKKERLEWRTVNIEEKGNEHFADDYKLYTKSVIVSTMRGGREVSWKNLDKIWQLVRDEKKYREYIRTEVQACLAGTCL
ncbi:MAG: hypothetical protein JXA71_01265 [Chitinispirillaceae bacterium]|nr:hypothetical protein [Chitinispirillaceae bacterium]